MELELAGIALTIKTPHIDKLRSVLSGYCSSAPQNTVPIEIEVTEQDILKEKEVAAGVFANRGEDRDFSELGCEFIALYKKILNKLIEHRVIYLHGSLLSVDGNGYLFMAPSGTGKSTHTRLWKERYGDRVTVINDDKPMVKAVGEGSVLAYGSPWNGKHGIGCNDKVPLRAIVRLRRGQKNVIGELDKREALKLLYLQTLHFETADKMQRLLEVMGAIIENVRFYDLQCNMEIEAAEVAYAVTLEDGGSSAKLT